MMLAATGLGIGVAATTFGFGVRHGIDWDHLAALTDLTSSQPSARRAIRMATWYALGHSAVVFTLGLLAIVFAEALPSSVDAAMARIVGATLVALGLYVFYGLARHGRDFRMRSRWMMVFDAATRLGRRLRRQADEVVVIEHEHEHDHGGRHAHVHPTHAGRELERIVVAHRHVHHHVVPAADDPFAAQRGRTAWFVGMLHGVGAETPTQVVLFVTAAGAAGRGAGVVLLACFVAGLLTSNTIVAVAGTAGVLSARRSWPVYVVVSSLIGCASLVIGALFLLGHENVFPTLLG